MKLTGLLQASPAPGVRRSIFAVGARHAVPLLLLLCTSVALAAAGEDASRKSDEGFAGASAGVAAQFARDIAKSGLNPANYKTAFDGMLGIVYMHANSDEEFAATKEGLRRYAAHQWKNLFQHAQTGPVRIVILTPQDSLKLYFGGRGGVFNFPSNILFCGTTPQYSNIRSDTLIHEYTHLLHHADMAARRQNHPIWITEGLATLFETIDIKGEPVPRGNYRLAVIRGEPIGAGRKIPEIPLRRLMGMDRMEFMRNGHVAYAEVLYVFYYMHEKGLLKTFYDEYTKPANYALDQSGLKTAEAVFGKPIEAVERDWMEWMLKLGFVSIPQLGIQIDDNRWSGLLVTDVTKGSPAAQAGIEKDDALTALDGVRVMTSAEVLAAVAARKPGDRVRLKVARQGKELTLEVPLGKKEPAAATPGNM